MMNESNQHLYPVNMFTGAVMPDFSFKLETCNEQVDLQL
jgi:hypothetical protein